MPARALSFWAKGHRCQSPPVSFRGLPPHPESPSSAVSSLYLSPTHKPRSPDRFQKGEWELLLRDTSVRLYEFQGWI